MPFRAVSSLAAWAASRLLHPGRARRAYRCGRPRIMKVHAAPRTPWMWTLAFGHHEDRWPTHGYEPTREAAMAASAKSWRRE